MLRMLTGSLLFSVCLSSAVVADIASGPIEPPVSSLVAPLTVEQGSDSTGQYKISLPKSVLLELLNEDRSSSASDSWMSWIAVVALTAAAISLLFAGKGNTKRRPVAIVLIVSCVSVGVTVLINRQGRPSESPGPNVGNARISLEVRDDGHDVVLHVPKTRSVLNGKTDPE